MAFDRGADINHGARRTGLGNACCWVHQEHGQEGAVDQKGATKTDKCHVHGGPPFPGTRCDSSRRCGRLNRRL